MNTETLDIDGYTVTIAPHEHAENPFTSRDGEPPLLVYSCDHSRGRLDTYGDAPTTLSGMVDLIPDAKFARGKRMALLKELKPSDYGWKTFLREFAGAKREWGYSDKDAFAEWFRDRGDDSPEGWRAAGEWFDAAEWLLGVAGIPCHSDESSGYCQGDVVKLLAMATPEWRQLVGCADEHAEAQCKAACDLYGAWAWGDVYGIAEITDPDGEEIPDGGAWGFYGSDHEKSGLLDSARDSIESHQRSEAVEAAECYAMECRDIETVYA